MRESLGLTEADEPRFLAASYVQEKMRCNISDAYVLAELLGELLGREYEKAGS